MRAYIETIGYFMVFSAFIQMLIPDKFRRDIGFFLGIAMLLAVCGPLKGILSKTPNIELPEAEAISQDNDELRKRMLSDGMRAELERVIAEQSGAEKAEAVINDDGSVDSVTLYGDVDESAKKIAADLCGIEQNKVKVR